MLFIQGAFELGDSVAGPVDGREIDRLDDGQLGVLPCSGRSPHLFHFDRRVGHVFARGGVLLLRRGQLPLRFQLAARVFDLTEHLVDASLGRGRRSQYEEEQYDRYAFHAFGFLRLTIR